VHHAECQETNRQTGQPQEDRQQSPKKHRKIEARFAQHGSASRHFAPSIVRTFPLSAANRKAARNLAPRMSPEGFLRPTTGHHNQRRTPPLRSEALSRDKSPWGHFLIFPHFRQRDMCRQTRRSLSSLEGGARRRTKQSVRKVQRAATRGKRGNGPRLTSALCPLLRDERKCLRRRRKSESDPKADLSRKLRIIRSGAKARAVAPASMEIFRWSILYR
jgi:hypothetical protein